MAGDIIAVLPEEVKGTGICARIYSQTEVKLSLKTPSLYLDTMYKDKGKNKKLVNKQISRELQISKNLPYVIDTSHVFFAFKYRKAIYDKQSRGFVNVKYVKKIVGSEIILITGESVATLATRQTLITNLNNAKLMLYKEINKSLIESDANIRYITARILDDYV
ncbi:hypothetical protein [Anaerococcus nagyae]|uniref:Uncharacterized protein n=1 Tax=Anaerococcus nagyae TaxID=1755241 RepID=A0A3E2TLV8_9FIRM|nr:hypothetical protein [Anaerococcus nagyae]RGB77880.1 hypothetical protein DXA39_00035 [Anaerococcus nagyae]